MFKGALFFLLTSLLLTIHCFVYPTYCFFMSFLRLY